MSSYVIDKVEYVKAAGIMCGFESAKRDPHKYFVDTIRSRFNDVYMWNVKSVAKQYGEKEVYDDNEYDDTFEKYKVIGRKVYRASFDVMPLNELRTCLFYFFRSALYQIEDELYAAKASEVFLECLTKLYEKEIYNVDGWWGKIEI